MELSYRTLALSHETAAVFFTTSEAAQQVGGTKKGRYPLWATPLLGQGRAEGAARLASRFEVDDELWAEIAPFIPVRWRRRRYPGAPSAR